MRKEKNRRITDRQDFEKIERKKEDTDNKKMRKKLLMLQTLERLLVIRVLVTGVRGSGE